MKLFLGLILGRLIFYISRLLKIGGGSAAPGLWALKIEPRLVEVLTKQIPQNIVITGTNGKTTTARMIAHFAKGSGLKVIRNHTGSNLERGIASTLLRGANVFHLGGGLGLHLVFDLGIWELDEADFNNVVPKIRPDIVIFLNVFRDQLDRYGEVDSVVKRWCETLQKMDKNTMVLVNGDDTNTANLIHCFHGKTQKFGVENYKIIGEAIEHKKTHLKLDFEAKNVKQNGLKGSTFYFSHLTSHTHVPIRLPLPGIYHIYDALAAMAASLHLGLPMNQLPKHLINFQPAFGRVEKFIIPRAVPLREWDGTDTSGVGYIFLIKNPAGATQVFETITPHIKPTDRLLLALNDNIADGTDVSWIWDVNFETLTDFTHKKHQRSAGVNINPPQWCTLIVSGTRSQDLALRLKYAGFDPKMLIIESNLEKAFKQAREGLKGTLFILPTYTAMLELQKILVKYGIKRHYWEEN